VYDSITTITDKAKKGIGEWNVAACFHVWPFCLFSPV
jgi:hypothetical protein